MKAKCGRRNNSKVAIIMSEFKFSYGEADKNIIAPAFKNTELIIPILGWEATSWWFYDGTSYSSTLFLTFFNQFGAMPFTEVTLKSLKLVSSKLWSLRNWYKQPKRSQLSPCSFFVSHSNPFLSTLFPVRGGGEFNPIMWLHSSSNSPYPSSLILFHERSYS